MSDTTVTPAAAPPLAPETRTRQGRNGSGPAHPKRPQETPEVNGNVIPLALRTQRATRSPEPAMTASPADASSPGQPAVYTVAQVAELLSLSPGTAYALVRSGEIPARKLGGKWVISRRRFHHWIDALPDATPEESEREFRKAGLLTDPAEEARP